MRMIYCRNAELIDHIFNVAELHVNAVCCTINIKVINYEKNKTST